MSQLYRKKMKNTNSNQSRKLMELMQRNPDVARGFIELRSGTIANELWNRFGVQLNRIGPPFHGGKEWHKLWLNYKVKLNMKFDSNRKEEDGGSPSSPRSLSSIQTAVDELLSLQKTLHPYGMVLGAGARGSGSRFHLEDNYDDDDSDGETFDAASQATGGPWETSDVASLPSYVESEIFEVTSETSDVAAEISGVASETSDVTSAISGVTSETLNITSASSDDTSASSDDTSASYDVTSETADVTTETSGVVSETSGVASATSDATSESPDREREQTDLLQTAKNIEQDIHEIAKLMRKGFNLKSEELDLLKAKEERQQTAYIDQLQYNKEKLDIKLLYLKLQMMQLLESDESDDFESE